LWVVYWGSLKVFGFVITYLVFGNVNEELTGAMWFAPIVVAHPFSMLVAWLAITVWGGRPFLKTVGIDWGVLQKRFGPHQNGLRRRVILCSVALGWGMWAINIAAHITLLSGGTRYSELPGNSLGVRLVEAALATFSAPIVEEVFYRGILYPKLERVAGAPLAVLLVSIAFAVTHMHQYSTKIGAISWLSVGIVFSHGLLLTLARWWTGSIIPSMLMHGVSNGLNTIMVKLILHPLLSPK
jgi:membrane protease YdiL (CAAX protease family)